MPDNNYGVIQEQGFIAGSNLGFTPVKENELQNDIPKDNKEEKEEK